MATLPEYLRRSQTVSGLIDRATPVAERLADRARRQVAKRVVQNGGPVNVAELRRQIEDEVINKALDAVGGAIVADTVLEKQFNSSPKVPGSSWSNMGGTPSQRLTQRVAQNLNAGFGRATPQLELAMAEQGLTWGPPFPPGRPLDPFYGYRRPPRTWDFQVGENVQLTPRWNRISFATLKAMYDAYDVAQICVRHLINDVRSLDYQFIPPANVQDDATEDVEAAENFMRYPDGQLPLRDWLHKFLQDVLRYDAGALYIRRDAQDRPAALEVVSGDTVIPLVDYFGRRPTDEVAETVLAQVNERLQEVDNQYGSHAWSMWDGRTVPAYLQIVQGLPWVWLAAHDMVYVPYNPMPDSQYGLAPLEAVLVTANTDLRFQYHFLQFFTDGTLPGGFMEAPENWSDPNQIRDFQVTWDALMTGDQAQLRKIRWVPSGAKFQATRADASAFDREFPLYLMRRVAAAFGITPNDLGFTEDVNRSTGEIQVDVQFRVGTLPLVRHLEGLLNAFIASQLKLKAQIAFDVGREIEDRLTTAQAAQIYWEIGAISSDEIRMQLGRRISRERPVPRTVNNQRAGPIPVLAVQSVAGKVDAMTYGPTQDQALIEHPFIPIPGAAPVIGSAEHTQAITASSQMQMNALVQTSDPRSAHRAIHADGHVQTEPEYPLPPATPNPSEQSPADRPSGQSGQSNGSSNGSSSNGSKAKGKNAKALAEAVELIHVLKDMVDNTGGAGVPRSFSPGLTVDTGIEGNDLQHHGVGRAPLDDDEDDDEETKTRKLLLRQWRENSLNRVKKGLAPKLFEDAPADLAVQVWPSLSSARTAGAVDHAFRLPKVPARKGLHREAAGLVVQAADTGRVLMIQRTPDKHDDGEAYARWEWPGGKLESSDGSVWDGAVREWGEETGADLPQEFELCGGWVSEDQEYEGFVVRVASEAALELHPQRSEVSNAAWWEPVDLDDPQVREKVTEELGHLAPILKAGDWRQAHRHTDRVIAHFTPFVHGALSQIFNEETLRQAARAAYGVSAATKARGQAQTKTVAYQRAQAVLTAALASAPSAVTGLGAVTVGGPAAAALTGALLGLYGNAAVQGAAWALAGVAVATAPAWYLALASRPGTGDEPWAPGAEAEAVAEIERQEFHGPMGRVVREVGDTVRGITRTLVDRIARLFATGVAQGRPMDEAIADAQGVETQSHATLVAETEYLRMWNLAARETWRKNRVQYVGWLHYPDACSDCLENAEVSPIPLHQAWPAGDVPVHPNCRCAEWPVEPQGKGVVL